MNRTDEVGPAPEAELEVLMRLGGRVVLSRLTLFALALHLA